MGRGGRADSLPAPAEFVKHPASSFAPTASASMPCRIRAISSWNTASAARTAAFGWLGRGTWRVNPRSRSHRHPVTGPTDTAQRPFTYRATFGPVHTPPSGGRFWRAEYRASRRRAVSRGSDPFPFRRSATPSGPRSFHRCGTARTVTADSPTTSATSAGVRGWSVRARSHRACHRGFSTGCRLDTYRYRTLPTGRWRTNGMRTTGFPPATSSCGINIGNQRKSV